MESFYGGKQGRSYKIVAHFDNIKDMVTAFREGGSYTDVAYDEYVIIDTILRKNEKNNAENGILYRRGYDYSEIFNPSGVDLNNNDTLTAGDTKTIILYADNYNQEYTYTDNSHLITGTYSISAVVPKYFDFTYIIKSNNEYEVDLLDGSFKIDSWNDDWAAFVSHPGGGAIYVGQIVGPEGDSPAVQVIEWDNLLDYNIDEDGGAGELVKGQIQITPKPGYSAAAANTQGYDANGYHDEIQYGYCTLRDAQGNVTGAYIAFDIPYVVFSFDAEEILPYNVPTNLAVENSDSIGHPYFKHYTVKIPRGIHGKDVTSMFIGNKTKTAAAESGAYLQYTSKDYSESNTGIEQTFELAPYRVIDSIVEIAYSGQYTYSNSVSTYNYPYQLQVNYTYGEPKIIPYNTIERVWYQENNNVFLEAGHIYIRMSNQDPNTDPIDAGLLKQIHSITKGQRISRVIGQDGNYTLVLVDSGDDLIYTNYNDGTYTVLDIAEIAGLAFDGDLLLIRFRNIDTSVVSQTYEYQGETWINLGTVINDNHVIGNFKTLSDLEAVYPNGLGADSTTENRAGWLVTVGHTVEIVVDENGLSVPEEDAIIENGVIVLPAGSSLETTAGLEIDDFLGYKIYAFDYLDENPHWYNIQDLSASSVKAEYSVLLSKPNGNVPAKNDQLNENGLWLVITE